MCGILVRVGVDRIDERGFQHLTDSLAHRGPDGRGCVFFLNNHIALGHRRLSILDVSSAGSQPMSDPTGRYWITFNGEIYNYLDLKKALISDGYEFKSSSDTEVLLALYREHGTAMLRLLRGMYAFAIWDSNTNRLFFARDPLGIKPLYIRQDKWGAALCSEAEPLKCLGSNTVSMLDVLRGLVLMYCPGDSFGIKEIKRVAPGGNGYISSNGEVEFLPNMPLLPDGRGPSGQTPLPSLEELEEVLEASITEHLISDVPVGIMFSGGLDSSIVASFASRTSKVHLFSMLGAGLQNADKIDTPEFSRSAAAALKLDLTFVPPPTELLGSLDAIVKSIGEPVCDPASLAAKSLAQSAREHGVPVLLSGHGGDELFAGYRRHRLARGWDCPPVDCALRFLSGIPALKRAKIIAVSGFQDLERVSLLQSVVLPHSLNSILSPEVFRNFAQGADILSVILAPLLAYEQGMAGASNLRRSLTLDFNSYLIDQNLNYLDKVAMMHGVEGRLPFLSRPVVSIAARYPDHYLLKAFKGKIPLRSLAKKILPRELLVGSKRGLGIPLRAMLIREWPAVQERMSSAANKFSHFWNACWLQKVAKSGPQSGEAKLIFSFLVVDQWLRINSK